MKHYTDTPFKCLMQSIQAKEKREAQQSSEMSRRQSNQYTPQDFGKQIHELGQTPGNLEDAGNLVGVIGSFEAQN